MTFDLRMWYNFCEALVRGPTDQVWASFNATCGRGSIFSEITLCPLITFVWPLTLIWVPNIKWERSAVLLTKFGQNRPQRLALVAF